MSLEVIAKLVVLLFCLVPAQTVLVSADACFEISCLNISPGNPLSPDQRFVFARQLGKNGGCVKQVGTSGKEGITLG